MNNKDTYEAASSYSFSPRHIPPQRKEEITNRKAGSENSVMTGVFRMDTHWPFILGQVYTRQYLKDLGP